MTTIAPESIPVISITADCLSEDWESTYLAFEMTPLEAREKPAQGPDWFRG